MSTQKVHPVREAQNQAEGSFNNILTSNLVCDLGGGVLFIVLQLQDLPQKLLNMFGMGGTNQKGFRRSFLGR